MKINEYPKTKKFKKSDLFLLDGENGTQTIKGEDLELQLNSMGTDPSWIVHRNTYRGKNLGSSFTEEQKAQIANNTFDDMYIGDYWVINGHIWTIADFNYWMYFGNTDQTDAFYTPHVNLIPTGGGNIYSSPMYNVRSTANGYDGSIVKQEIIPQFLDNYVKPDFGASNIVKHDETISNAIANGEASYKIEENIEAILMTEGMVTGQKLYTYTQPYYTSSQQLAFFKLNPSRIGTIKKPDQETYYGGIYKYWLREPSGMSTWTMITTYRNPGWDYADKTGYAVIPIFGIKG